MVMLLPVVLLHIVENDLRRREAMFRERERERERERQATTYVTFTEREIDTAAATTNGIRQ